MIYVLGAFFSFFLIVILLHKNRNQSDYILMIWLLLLGLDLFVFYYQNNYEFLRIYSVPIPLLHGPLLFLYTKSLLNFKVNKLLIFIFFFPCAVCLLVLVDFFIFMPKNVLIEVKQFSLWESVYYVFVVLTGFTCVFFSLKILYKYEKNFQKAFNAIERANLNWLKFLIFGIGITWFSIFFDEPEVTLVSLSVFVFCLGYYGIIQAPIFYKFQIQPGDNSLFITKPKKSTNDIFSISSDNEKEILDGLNNLIKKKLYLKADFTQQTAAKKIKTNTTYLSLIVNKHYKKSFSNYLNELRINYVVNEITINSKYREYTTQAIAESAGFKNADSFTTSFKKKMGVTPFQFIKDIKEAQRKF
jgi:AraC-like DNA-binding protein